MNTKLANDLQNIDSLLEAVKLQGFSFLNQIDERPTSTQYAIQASDILEDTGFGGIETLKRFNEKFELKWLIYLAIL